MGELRGDEARYSSKKPGQQEDAGEAMTASDGKRPTCERTDRPRDDKRKRAIKCYNGSKMGHIARDCRSKGGRQEGAGESGTADYAMVAVVIKSPETGAVNGDDVDDGSALSAADTPTNEWW